MLNISAATPDELAVLVTLDPATPPISDDAAQLHLLYSDCARGNSVAESYERFRQSLSLRWGKEVNPPTAYLVAEGVMTTTNNVKKKHFAAPDSKSSELPPTGKTPPS